MKPSTELRAFRHDLRELIKAANEAMKTVTRLIDEAEGKDDEKEAAK